MVAHQVGIWEADALLTGANSLFCNSTKVERTELWIIGSTI